MFIGEQNEVHHPVTDPPNESGEVEIGIDEVQSTGGETAQDVLLRNKAIIGGLVTGLIALVCVIICIVYVVRKIRRNRGKFSKHILLNTHILIQYTQYSVK